MASNGGHEKCEMISIIIPTYKRETEFERALLCAIHQTYINKEIIVVDDNAENAMYREKVREIVSRYPEVNLLENSMNLGGALSRNRGIESANGELLAFLDDDDECLPERLDEQYKLYKRHEAEGTGLIYSNDHGIDFSKNLIYQHMLRIISSTSSWLIPKNVMLSLGCFDDVPSEQDTTFLFKLLRAGYKIYPVPKDLVIWNKHDSNSGISGVKQKNIDGTEKLRQLYRANYHLLDDSQQIKNVEYNLSAKLLPKYLNNQMVNEAKRELHYMITVKPFAKKTIKAIIQYIFPCIVRNTGN